MLGNQPNRIDKVAYAKLKTKTEITPNMMVRDAMDANALPCSNARKNATGPDVNGSPMSQPLIVGPHLRPAKLTMPMNVGTRSSFMPKINQSIPSIIIMLSHWVNGVEVTSQNLTQ
jgi:hypothetical protein